MTPAKQKIPAPIDRPLSKAYLRQFSGWATAQPPGLADPTSLRLMENAIITPAGAIAVRPALRSIFADDVWFDTTYGFSAVGSFESFFLNDGRKALLFAVRETIAAVERVGFKIAVYDEDTGIYAVHPLDAATIGFDLPQGYETVAFTSETTYVKYVQIDNKIFALSDAGEAIRMFWVGETKKAKKLTSITEPDYVSADRLSVVHPTAAWIAGAQTSVPTAETPTTSTLIHSTAASNTYNFAYFYSFNNEIGESAPSMLTVVTTQRGWSAWQKNAANDAASADQLVAILPSDVWASALAQGAISWNLYMLTWSDQSAVPVEGVLIKTTSMEGEATYATKGWAAHTPLVEGREVGMALPNAGNRYNYSDPSKAAQGIVAGDRLVLVNDKTNAAVIRWSSNQQGDYTNFSSSVGGGYKTLTSGNLYIPACVKLWQNPQSVDTLTVLCAGVDGYSTSYYMNPGSSVDGQTQSTVVMGFEETTATPGTVSPYGCEVLNNALFHPLDGLLMKSTASNYNINHKSMTDTIQNKWVELLHKERIISSQLDNKLYFIVNNPDGEELLPGCNGNEIWVCNTAEEGTWSRWLIQATSLRKLEVLGRLYMGVVRPDSIYVLNERAVYDTVNVSGATVEQPIPWMWETNTQGANRAHDAWCHLQQVGVVFGNFQGAVEWGIVGWDINGKAISKKKIYRDLRAVDMSERPMPYDMEDFLRIARDMKEWRLFARSVPGELCFGQLNLAQYRYTPSSVNTGTEWGEVETFEYERATANWAQRTTDGGIPQPMLDTRYP